MFEDLTQVQDLWKVCTDEKQIPGSENLVQLNLAPNLETESCKFSYIDDDSLIKQRICDNCKALLNDTTNTLIRRDTCLSVHLKKDCEEKFHVRLSRNRQTFVFDAHISSWVLPKGAVVGQNEDLIVYISSNILDVTHKNHCIISLEVTKNSTTFRSQLQK